MSKIATISQVILQRIRSQAYNGRIPGERALATEFGVDFKTVNRAVTLLVQQGTVQRRRGLGTFVTPLDQPRILTIGLCFFKTSDPGRDPIFARFFAAMNRAIKAHGMRLDVTALADVGPIELGLGELTDRFRRQVLATNSDGLIYLGNVDVALLEQLRAERPTIVVAHTPPDVHFDCVRRDVRAAVGDAVRRLHWLGHRRIALASYAQTAAGYDLFEKEAGYATTTAELGLWQQVLRVSDATAATLPQLIVESELRPTAIICTESTLALALVEYGPALGLSLPHDLAIITFDDGEIGRYTRPTLTGITAYGETLAEHAVNRLVERLTGRQREPINDILPCVVTERASHVATRTSVPDGHTPGVSHP